MGKHNSSLYKHASRNGFNTTSGFNMIGFALDSLAAAQVPYTCIYSCNEWLSKNFGINFSIFQEDNAMPCIAPQFARFHIRDSAGFTGHLISTSLASTFSIKDAVRAKRYYYINDITEVLNCTKEQFKQIFTDNKLTVFTRSSDYYDILISKCDPFRNNLRSIIVEDFNIDQILEIINGEKHR